MTKTVRAASRTAAVGGLLAVVLAAAGAAVTVEPATAGPLPSGACVPDVVGMSEQDARVRLQVHGYRVRVFWQKGGSDDGVTRVVVVQQPAAGAPARPSTVVSLVMGD